MVERLNGIQEVRGSTPLVSTTRKDELRVRLFLLCAVETASNSQEFDYNVTE